MGKSEEELEDLLQKVGFIGYLGSACSLGRGWEDDSSCFTSHCQWESGQNTRIISMGCPFPSQPLTWPSQSVSSMLPMGSFEIRIGMKIECFPWACIERMKTKITNCPGLSKHEHLVYSWGSLNSKVTWELSIIQACKSPKQRLIPQLSVSVRFGNVYGKGWTWKHIHSSFYEWFWILLNFTKNVFFS